MDQNVDKLLRYLVNSDGLLDSSYARLIFGAEITVEYFEDYKIARNEFEATPQSLIFQFANAYYDKYACPPTEDALMHELLTNSDLSQLRKQELTKALMQIRAYTPSPSEFPYVRDRVKDQYVAAKAVQIMQQGTETIKIDPVKGVTFVQQGLAGVLSRAVISDRPRDKSLQLHQFASYLLDEFDQHGELMHGAIAYPYDNFNQTLGGMVPGELIVIAGPPNTGKSFVGRDIAYGVGIDANIPTVCADREMVHDQQGVRWLAYLTKIPQRKLKNAHLLSPAEKVLVREALLEYADVNNPANNSMLMIPPTRAMNTAMIRREIETAWGSRQPKLIVADYLNEFQPSQRSEGWEAVRRVLSDLKDLGMYFECPVVTIAQTDDKGVVKYKSVREVCDTLLVVSMNKDQPYIPPSNENSYTGTPGLLDVWVDKSRNEAKHVLMHLEVEFATASIRPSRRASTPVAAGIEQRRQADKSPYDEDRKED